MEKLARFSPSHAATTTQKGPTHDKEFQFFKFSKVQVMLRSFILDSCIAVRFCLLRDDEIDELLDVIKSKPGYFKTLILEDATTIEANAYFWNQMFEKKITMKSLSSLLVDGQKVNLQVLFKSLKQIFSENDVNYHTGSPVSKSKILKPLEGTFDSHKANWQPTGEASRHTEPSLDSPGKLSPQIRKVNLSFRNIESKEFFDVFHAEKFLFEQPGFEIRSLEIRRSPMLMTIIENGATGFKHLRRLAISDALIERSYLSFQLAGIRTLKHLHFSNVDSH